MRSADLNEMLLSGELAALTGHLGGTFPDPAHSTAATNAASPEAGADAAPRAPPARSERKRAASPVGAAAAAVGRTSFGAIVAPPPLDLHGFGEGSKRQRSSPGVGWVGGWVRPVSELLSSAEELARAPHFDPDRV